MRLHSAYPAAWLFKGLRLKSILLLALQLACNGCLVHQYQPLSGLHQPVIVDPGQQNLPDVALVVRCVADGALDWSQARALCDKVSTLFENQGATVTDYETLRNSGAEGDAEEGEPPRRELSVELKVRRTHRSARPLSWIPFFASFSVVPAATEWSFAQDIVIRDETGFLLVAETLEGRLVSRFGLGHFLLTGMMDLGRKRSERVIGGADRSLSEDLYGQLSQLVFNAKRRRDILQAATGER